MRTYSRKRIENEEIANVEALCRLCLEEMEESVPIFSSDNDACTSLSLRIMSCVGLEMTREDNMPNSICNQCHNELDRYYTFRKKCTMSYQKLKSHVEAVKQRAANVKVQGSLDPMILEDDSMELVINDNQAMLNTDVNSAVSSELVLEDDETTSEPTNVHSEDPSFSPDISMFLSTILVELGVLTVCGDSLMVTDPSFRTVELETGDGIQYVFSLLEENEEPTSQINGQLNRDTENINNLSSVIKKSPKDSKKKESGGVGGVPVCGECGKRFVSRGVLRRHAAVHTGERPHACQHCGRRFTQRAILRRHELVHHKDRPFACELCPKSFTQRGALEAHARSHAPPHARPLRLHACPHCPKHFLYPSGLSRHMTSHAGRVYVCGGCGKQFSDKSSLMRHIRTTKPAHPPHPPAPTPQPAPLSPASAPTPASAPAIASCL